MRALVWSAVFALFAASTLGAASSHAADTELGLELIPWSKKVGDRRYESPRDYDGTIKFFKDKFKGYKNIKWTREVSLPAVKYIHLENTNNSSKWHSVNIYEFPDRRVRYFVLDRQKPPAAAASVEKDAKVKDAKAKDAKAKDVKPSAKPATP